MAKPKLPRTRNPVALIAKQKPAQVVPDKRGPMLDRIERLERARDFE